MEEKCTFNDENKNCNCILHCKKDNWFDLKNDGSKDWSKSKKNIDRFWEKIQERLKYLNEHEQDVYENNNNPERDYTEYIDFDKPLDYEKYIFPEFQEEIDNTIGKNFYTIATDKDSKEYEVHIFQDKNLEFKDCDFCGKIDFKKYTFSKSIKFLNCDFHNNDIDLSNKIFNKSLFFKDCKNIGKLDLHGSTIEGSASFKGSEFNEVEFERVNFNTAVAFNEAKFYNDIDFKYTIFNGLVFFQDVTIQKSLNLLSTIFKDEVNFLGIKNKDGKNLETDNIKNRETVRIIKHSFEKLDNIIEVNKFYALEMQKREEELSKEKNWLDLIVFKFHKISSNHSQDWLLALLWMINLTFVYTSFQFIEALDSHWLFLYSFLSIGLIITSIEGLAYLEIPKDYKGLFCVIFIFFNWISYSLITNDYTMCYASNNFNPFSIMTGKESLTFATLIYKAIITYLIYQFIISIRQNTRRK
jgi:uncharacterized protein YjbI with pentapeptide repeats